MLHTVLIVSVCGIALSWLIEALCIRPKSLFFWQRCWPANLVHISNWCLCFSLLLTITARPWFSLSIICCAQFFMLLVNQAKYHSLREPFLAQDFEYFSDAIKHPRLYLPFFGVWRIILAVVAVSIAIILGLTFEASMLDSVNSQIFILNISWLMLASAGLLFFAVKKLPHISLNPEQDQHALGQFAFLYSYFSLLCKPTVIDAELQMTTTLKSNTPVASLPHVVAVQSESFFDPRACYSTVNPSILQHFDRACQQSMQFGNLDVPAWGANTVRTEAAFLTGLSPKSLGIHQFNPYRLFARQPVNSLAKVLKTAGYKTLCIHPYPVSFYLRDKVFPTLGFDSFIDVSSFTDAQKKGQYTSDQAIAEKVDQLLREADQALFIFVITMENHGPLHLETPLKDNLEEIFTEQGVKDYLNQSATLADLNVYLRHLKNADLMVEKITDSLQQQNRPGLLAWYGDHIPIMPKVYAKLGEPTPDTPYLIWHSKHLSLPANNVNTQAHTLSEQILSYLKL